MDDEERAMMRRDGQIGFLVVGVENNRIGHGRGGDGGVKMFRSSNKNLEGGGISVITSSISHRLQLNAQACEKSAVKYDKIAKVKFDIARRDFYLSNKTQP